MDTAKLADQTSISAPEALWIPVEYRLIASWRVALRQFFSASKVILKEHGVTSMQYQTLLAIRTSEDPEGINMNGLAAYLGVRHNSAVGLINRLEGSGLVRRARSERDRRVAHLKLTPEGEARLKALVEAHRQELLNIRSEMRRIFK